MTLAVEEKLVKQESTFYSSEEIDDYTVVVGISICPDSANCSFAYKHNPFAISNISSWASDEAESPILSEDDEKRSRFPTIVKYTENNDEFLIGNKVLYEHPPYAEEINVYDVIFDYLSGQNKLLAKFQTLDVNKVVSRFLESLLKEASGKFEKIAENELESFKSVFKRQSHGDEREEEIQRIETEFKLSADRCRYCISGPSDQRFKDLMRMSFVSAGIIKENDPEDRLMFVSGAEALGYYAISTSGYEEEYKYRYKYIFCDINYTHTDFAEIFIDDTQSSSTVVGYSINNIPEIQGWAPLERLYRQYLEESNIESGDIEQEAEIFLEGMKETQFSFEGDKQEKVLAPLMDACITAAASAYDMDEKIISICYFGSVMEHSDFNNYFTAQSDRSVIKLDTNSSKFSHGAVTRALRVKNAQIPSTAVNIPTEDERRTTSLADKPVTSENYEFVVGMDFGTTYSGCCFASTKNGRIQSIKDWPGKTKEFKTPTLLLYNKQTNSLGKQWGSVAKKYVKKDVCVIESFKLLISPQAIEFYYKSGNKDIDEIEKSNTHKGVQVKDMIATYISKLNEEVMKVIKPRLQFRKPKVKYVLTVPCMWSETARTTMREAAVKAGLASQEENITIITEPEAASLCFDKQILDLSKAKSYFIVCDAGGGTVDLITYMAGEMDDGQPSICQVGEGCGKLCGSNRINNRFKLYLNDCFPEEFFERDKLKETLGERFENEKRAFTGSNDIIIPIPQKWLVHEDIIKKKCKGGSTVVKGQFIVPSAKARELFDIYIDKTIDLLDEEYNKTASTSNPAKSVFLLGGFSESAYFQERVKSWCQEKKIELNHPTDKMRTAVSFGAVSYGSKPRIITKKNAGQSYALLLDLGNGIRKFDYFIKKGQEIPTSQPIYEKEIGLNTSGSTVVAIYSTEDDKIEEDFDKSFCKVLELRLDRYHAHNNRDRTAIIRLHFSQAGVHCYVVYGRNNIVYDSAISLNHIVYRLRFRGLRDNKNAFDVLNNFTKYSPLHSK